MMGESMIVPAMIKTKANKPMIRKGSNLSKEDTPELVSEIAPLTAALSPTGML